MPKPKLAPVNYAPVDGIIDDFLARGEHPSVEKIRATLGRGSFEIIARYLHARGLSALDPRMEPGSIRGDPLPAPAVVWPVPDPAAVAGVLYQLRWDTSMMRAEHMAERFNGGSSNGRTREHPTDRQA